MSGASGLRKHDHSSAGQGGTGATPSAHHTTHENGGSDEIDATGLTGVGGGSLTDHTHAATGTGSNGGGATLQPTTLDIPNATSPAQTAEGRAVWDSDDDVLTVGDGSSRKTLMNRVTTTRGDIIVRGASVDGRLAIGAANTVLHGSATDPAYSAVVEGDLSTSDITTANVSSTKHGLTPKSPADATQFLNGAATPAFAAVKDSDLSTTDITTNDVSTSKHGFAPKAPNDATKFLDGTGTYSSLPAGGGTRVYNSGAFAVSASTETAITFDTERSDSDAFHSTGSQTERLTVPTGKGGRYAIGGTVEWAASALGTLRRLSIRLNGTTYLAKDEITSIINAALPQNVATVYDLVAGDYVELVAFQDTVGSVNLQASGNYSPEFGMMLAGPAPQAFAGVQAYNSTTQAISANTNTACTLDSEDFDTGAFHSTSSNTSRITIPAGFGGYYLLTGTVFGAANPNTALVAWFRKNNTSTVRGSVSELRATASAGVQVTALANLVATDYVELFCFISSSINIGDATNIEYQTTFRAVLLGV